MAPPVKRLPIRVAVLMTDTPVPAVQKDIGDYAQVFYTLFRAAADRLALPADALQWSKYDVVERQEYPESLDGIDAILITGSKFNAFDDTPWIIKLVDYTRMVLAQDRVRIVGVCFGHQILARALDAPVVRNKAGWEVSVCGVDLTDKGKELFGKEKLMLNPHLQAIQQMHLDIVSALPEGAESLGSSPTCAVQGLYARRRFISVQGHPEFTTVIMTEIVAARRQLGVFDDATADEYASRANNAHDGVQVAEAFLHFLAEE